MPYGWHNEALLLSDHQWVNWGTFLHILNSFKYKQYSVAANRDEMRNQLANLTTSAPFSDTTRFPDSIYIDLNHSVPNNLMRQMLSALDFKDRQAEKGRAEPDALQTRMFSNLEDAKTAFYRALFQFVDIGGQYPIERMYIVGIFTRGSFERVYELVWT